MASVAGLGDNCMDSAQKNLVRQVKKGVSDERQTMSPRLFRHIIRCCSFPMFSFLLAAPRLFFWCGLTSNWVAQCVARACSVAISLTLAIAGAIGTSAVAVTARLVWPRSPDRGFRGPCPRRWFLRQNECPARDRMPAISDPCVRLRRLALGRHADNAIQRAAVVALHSLYRLAPYADLKSCA